MSKKVKENLLYARWSKKLKDIIYFFPSRPDGNLLNNILTSKRHHSFDEAEYPSFIEELEARGYDLTTLKFSIERKPQVNNSDPIQN